MNAILGLHPDEDEQMIANRREAVLIKNFRVLDERQKNLLVEIVKLMSEDK